MQHYFNVTRLPSRRNWFFSFLGSWFKSLNVTGWLIVFNVFIFIIESIAGFFNNADCSLTICNYLALQPNNLFVNNYYWILITSIFSHGGFFHLFINMISLYFVGNFLEMLIGKKRFFWLYIFSGILAGLFFAFFAFYFGDNWVRLRLFGNGNSFAVGASGAIFALAGVLALLTPRNKVYLIAGPIIAIVIESILGIVIKSSGFANLLSILVSIYVFVCIFSMFSFDDRLRLIGLPIRMSFWILPFAAIIPLMIIGFFIALPIGNMAHLGGLIAGLVYGFYLRLRYKKKTQIISRYYTR